MKKAQGLPVNVVVMMILGLVLFGLGMALFANIAGSSEDSIEDLNNQIKSNIAELECQGDQWICSPTYKMRNGGRETFELFVANKADLNAEYRVQLALTEVDAGKFGIQNDCGAVIISYPNIQTNILSGYSASFPFIVRASRVGETPCSFVTTATLYNENDEEKGKTPVIVRVE